MPGKYTVTLTVDGKIYTQTFTIKMDPRVKTSLSNLQTQHDLSWQGYNGRKECMKILDDIRAYRVKIKNELSSDEFNKKDKALRELEITQQGSIEPSFGRLNNGFASAFGALQDSDMPPTTQMINAVKELNQQMIVLKKKWEDLKK
jgi:hypothetical protein